MEKKPGQGFWDADITMSSAASKVRDPHLMTRPYDDGPIDVTFFVSCYNESEYIVPTLDLLCEASETVGLKYEIIVIDDCSKDNSAEVVRNYITGHPDRTIILRANHFNKGLAQNYIDGAFLGKGKYYRLICGDNTETKESIVAVLSAIGKADCVVPFSKMQTRSLARLVISRGYTFTINKITKNRIPYYNGQAVHLRYNVMRWHTNTRGFGFQAELLVRLIDLGFTYVEVPIETIERRLQSSNALTIRNMLSVAHTIVEIANSQIAKIVYSGH